MKKFYLNLENEASEMVFLAGLVCSEPDYKLIWLLNKVLDIKLVKADDIELVATKNKELDSFVYYRFKDDESNFSVYLIANKGERSSFIENLRTLDYIFMIKGGNIDKLASQYASQLRSLDYLSMLQLDDVVMKKSLGRFRKIE